MSRRSVLHRVFAAAGISLAVFAVFAQILFAIAIPQTAAADDLGLSILCSGHVADDASGQAGDSAPGSKHCPQCQAVWVDKLLPVERASCASGFVRAAVTLHFISHDALSLAAWPAMPPPARGPPSIA